MSKKQLIILISVFFVIFGSIILIFIIMPNIDSNKLKIGDYKLRYGLYEGYEKEYDNELDKVVETKKEIVLMDDEKIKMGDEIYTFSVKGNKIYIYTEEYFEVTGNNKLTLTIGGGIDYEWKKQIKE